MNWGFIGIYNKRQHFNMHFYQRNPKIINRLIDKVNDFWNKVDNDIAYPELQKDVKEFVDFNNHKASNALLDTISKNTTKQKKLGNSMDRKT